MKTRRLTIQSEWVVESEPGDGTRYEYTAWKTDSGYSLRSNNNHFHYPEAISIVDANEVVTKSVMEERSFPQVAFDLADAFSCNVYTVLECCRTIIEIENDKV